jgi:hypothetical protein
MRVAHIENGIVTNISVRKHIDNPNLVCVDNIHCNIGDTYADGVFIPKVPSIEETLELRKAAYPPLGDLADALYWQSKGDSSKMTEYLANCEAVKLKYPKR